MIKDIPGRISYEERTAGRPHWPHPVTMSNDSHPSTDPLDRYPEPVCWFDDADSAAIVAVNDAFEAHFGAVSAGTPISTVFETFTLESRDRGPPTGPITSEDQYIVETSARDAGDTRTYIVQQVPPTTDARGYLLFAPQEPNDRGVHLGVDHVTSVVSHDLRNPLDVAKAHLEAARATGEAQHFDQVHKAHTRMERIIEDVLTLARGDEVVSPDERVDLGQVASEAWESVETHDTSLERAAELPTTRADAGRVKRLFENLFRNAIEHGHEAPGSPDHGTENEPSSPSVPAHQPVTVTVGGLTDSGFFVEDDGQGIPATDRKAVLEPGFTTDEHGTGLGLAIVARIVDLHEWSLTITESTDGGARFEIRGLA